MFKMNAVVGGLATRACPAPPEKKKGRRVTFSPSLPTGCDKNNGSGRRSVLHRRRHRLSAQLVQNQECIEKMVRLLVTLLHVSRDSGEISPAETDENGDHVAVLKDTSCLKSMKVLWNHVKSCPKGSRLRDKCSFPMCNLARYVIFHYKNCFDWKTCPVCHPVRVMVENKRSITSEPYDGNLTHFLGRRGNATYLPEVRIMFEPEANLFVMYGEGGDNSMDDLTVNRCSTILQNLLKHEHGWVFSSPVDPVLLGIPDYLDVITQPMDLGTIEARLEDGHYKDVVEFLSDILLTFDNAITYNVKGTEVHNMAGAMKNFFIADAQSLFNV